ncbi:MAG: hypothetical protein GY939_28520 [Actinomycetia bacterium]|nr:hypothetical protein [Actinomycetes bacterium]
MSSGYRWFGVGASDLADPLVAADTATVAALTGTDPKLVVVFASISYDLPTLVGAIGELTPGVPMIGCTTAGEISTQKASDHSVVVSVLGGEFSAVTSCATGAGEDLTAAGAKAASAMTRLPHVSERVLLLLTDGLAGSQQDVVRGAYSEVGASVPLVGGCAGDDAAMIRTFQIHDGEVHENTVVAAAIGSESPFGIGVHHGWHPVGEPLLVTNSHETKIHELDGEPALDVYLDCFGASRSVADDPRGFTDFAVTRPLGLQRRSGKEVRFINGADFASRSLMSIAEVPQGSLVWMMEGDRESLLAGTAASCDEALHALGESEPIGLLVFDCIARRAVLGSKGVQSEMQTIAKLAPSVPTAGLYTYGEIARTQGVRGFHNQTLVTLALS